MTKSGHQPDPILLPHYCGDHADTAGVIGLPSFLLQGLRESRSVKERTGANRSAVINSALNLSISQIFRSLVWPTLSQGGNRDHCE